MASFKIVGINDLSIPSTEVPKELGVKEASKVLMYNYNNSHLEAPAVETVEAEREVDLGLTASVATEEIKPEVINPFAIGNIEGTAALNNEPSISVTEPVTKEPEINNIVEPSYTSSLMQTVGSLENAETLVEVREALNICIKMIDQALEQKKVDKPEDIQRHIA